MPSQDPDVRASCTKKFFYDNPADEYYIPYSSYTYESDSSANDYYSTEDENLSDDDSINFRDVFRDTRRIHRQARDLRDRSRAYSHRECRRPVRIDSDRNLRGRHRADSCRHISRDHSYGSQPPLRKIFYVRPKSSKSRSPRAHRSSNRRETKRGRSHTRNGRHSRPSTSGYLERIERYKPEKVVKREDEQKARTTKKKRSENWSRRDAREVVETRDYRRQTARMAEEKRVAEARRKWEMLEKGRKKEMDEHFERTEKKKKNKTRVERDKQQWLDVEWKDEERTTVKEPNTEGSVWTDSYDNEDDVERKIPIWGFLRRKIPIWDIISVDIFGAFGGK